MKRDTNIQATQKQRAMLQDGALTPRIMTVLYEAMESAELEQHLLRVQLFAVLTPAEISILAKSLASIVVEDGEFVYRQGDDGDTFFIICSGQVEKVVESANQPEIVVGQPLTSGNYFGQLGLLHRDEKRKCSMRAKGPAELRYICRSDFCAKVGDLGSLLKRDPAEWRRYEAYFKQPSSSTSGFASSSGGFSPIAFPT